MTSDMQDFTIKIMSILFIYIVVFLVLFYFLYWRD